MPQCPGIAHRGFDRQSLRRRRVRVGGLRGVVLRRRLRLFLRLRRLLLLLGGLLLLLGAMMTDSASYRRAGHRMMARHVTGDAADRSALEAPCRNTRAGKCGQYQEAEEVQRALAQTRRDSGH